MFFTREVKYSLFLLILPLGLLGCSDQTETNKRPVQSIHVDTSTLTYSTLRLTTELPGRITAFKEAEVRPQITGIIESRLYKEGSYVEKGDVLFQIDPTTYQSTVNSANAELKKALSSERNAKKEMARYAQLLKKKLSSQQLFDSAEAAYLEAKAEVAVRQATLDYANIELSYTKIKAPISGNAGFSQVSEGSLLTSGQSDYITTVIQTDNVYIDMQQSAVAFYKIQQEFKNATTKNPTVPVSITLEDGTIYDQTGHLEFTDTQTNGSTGTVALRAIIANPDNALLAGMYVRAKISMPEARDYLIVKQSTVVRSQSGLPSVFIVDDNNQIVKKSIVLGNEVDNGWVVKEGLKAGDNVVINNLAKVKNGLTVIVDNASNTATTKTDNQSKDQD
ncbi:efflux RND transporter periplasmic adaptor subunit [Psychromonas sp. SR45-3]|uniref:efflux RND transporter periplasmic adaptor subunit n=1 Tax=Psychromonas sp. SR45-3 TaxID=2760930 RepID=UPI0015F897E0|nr:efflux RND transporter periplasmic adaptor subunit [Psychromonas sp. SR45-3]MBB1273709.1 efflux RND transporter periplasmic adaptor subunit [Psychromonas sp. SR45-3]